MSSIISKFDKLSSDQLLSLIRISEASERYNDMTSFMHQLVLQRSKASQELSIKERNFLSVAYKNTVSNMRSSLRIIMDNNDKDNDIINKYKLYIENEIKKLCLEILTLLIDHLLINEQNDKDDETEVFYLKMCGDYYRYLSELVIDKENKTPQESKYAINSEKYYNQSYEIAKAELSSTHPTRLGLALNFSVCLYEILSKKNEACSVAKDAFDLAMNKLDTLKDDNSYQQTTQLMEVIRDNLQFWSSEI